jgi:hypothetical protein
LAIKRPASPEEEEDASSERKDHLASATANTENNDKKSQHVSASRKLSPRKQTAVLPHKNSEIGSNVICHVRGKAGSLKGVLKWIGHLPTLSKKKENIVAGIELVKEDKLGTDGSFMGKRYFTATPKHGYFVRYKDCRKVN